MTDLDLERLANVWRQPPDATELEELRRTAAAVRRRARWAQMVDAGAAIVVAIVVLTLVLANPRPVTALVGGATILVLLGSQFRQRRLRQEELRALTGSTEEMLDQSIRRARATLKRMRFQLVGLGPSLALGLAFASAADQSRTGARLRDLLFAPWAGTLLVVLAAIAIGGFAVHFVHSSRAARLELERLIALREAYRQERESSS
jgi:hypothetical protein